jgi:hypothetical protein
MPDIKLTSKQKDVVKAMREGYGVEYEVSPKGHMYNFSVNGIDCPFADFFGLIMDKFIERNRSTLQLTTLGKTINID